MAVNPAEAHEFTRLNLPDLSWEGARDADVGGTP